MHILVNFILHLNSPPKKSMTCAHPYHTKGAGSSHQVTCALSTRASSFVSSSRYVHSITTAGPVQHLPRRVALRLVQRVDARVEDEREKRGTSRVSAKTFVSFASSSRLLRAMCTVDFLRSSRPQKPVSSMGPASDGRRRSIGSRGWHARLRRKIAEASTYHIICCGPFCRCLSVSRSTRLTLCANVNHLKMRERGWTRLRDVHRARPGWFIATFALPSSFCRLRWKWRSPEGYQTAPRPRQKARTTSIKQRSEDAKPGRMPEPA